MIHRVVNPVFLSTEDSKRGSPWSSSTRSVVLLAATSPILAAVAVLIKVTSPGPVLFRQRRPGLNGAYFTMLKLRTMKVGAEEEEGENWQPSDVIFFKPRNDPRIIPAGKVLRRYSIDELPQLLNVLKGDMSLVGPRPILSRDYERLRDPSHHGRFRMKPGLTGLWQVNGRSNSSDEDRIRADLEYVDNWSLMMDLKILLKTVPTVLKGEGAV